ncbi:MAG: coenzyme A pyrophosphatase [Nitrospinota bacterium]|nr:MAG: coenzyme A pyrophosphatase [Nitrospinota bacterium]
MDLIFITNKLKNQFPLNQQVVEPHPKKAAILVMLYPKHNKTYILMIKRALHLKSHAGEIGFPGGVYEKDEDKSLLATALRETQEEVGVQVEASQVIAQLPIVNTRLGFEITPFVSVFSAAMEFKLQEDEVEEILEIPLTSLLPTQQRDVSFSPEQDMVMYWFKQNRVWGASAQILREI